MEQFIVNTEHKNLNRLFNPHMQNTVKQMRVKTQLVISSGETAQVYWVSSSYNPSPGPPRRCPTQTGFVFLSALNKAGLSKHISSQQEQATREIHTHNMTEKSLSTEDLRGCPARAVVRAAEGRVFQLLPCNGIAPTHPLCTGLPTSRRQATLVPVFRKQSTGEPLTCLAVARPGALGHCQPGAAEMRPLPLPWSAEETKFSTARG